VSRATESAAVTQNATIRPIPVAVAAGAIGEYLAVGPREGVQPPAEGFALLVVLPGGDGSADFHPFVRRIHENALDDSFLVAQPLTVQWTPDQQIVWPTAKNPVAGAKFSTEHLVAAVVNDMAEKQKLNRQRVYLLAWSSGGPAAYATLLADESPAAGGLIAMSVFQPDYLPPVANAKGRRFYLLHSPDDQVCPYRMAETAARALAEAGGRTTLVQYAGGHGWQGDVFGNIQRGIAWLDSQQ
jgi:predicted esterase